jgi:hypothetical protein
MNSIIRVFVWDNGFLLDKIKQPINYLISRYIVPRYQNGVKLQNYKNKYINPIELVAETVPINFPVPVIF